jgi:hypothetical protein
MTLENEYQMLLLALLLAGCYGLFGVSGATLFVLNLIFALALVLMLYSVLVKVRLPQWYCFAILLLTVYVMPLPFLVFNGLEHVMHILFTILLVHLSVKTLCSSCDHPSGRSTTALYIVTPLVVMAQETELLPCTFTPASNMNVSPDHPVIDSQRLITVGVFVNTAVAISSC